MRGDDVGRLTTAATRHLFETFLTGPAPDVAYQTMWVRMMAGTLEDELQPVLTRWRQWAP